MLEWTHTEVAVIRRLFPSLPDLDAYEASSLSHTQRSNEALCATVEAVADVHEHGHGEMPNPEDLKARCNETFETVTAQRNDFIARHQDMLLRALAVAA